MQDVHLLVTEFRNATVELINCLESNKYDELDAVLLKRQEIIDLFKDNSFNKQELIEEFRLINIEELDNRATKLLQYNMETIKEKLRLLKSDMFLKKNYNQDFSGNPLFFNKKI